MIRVELHPQPRTWVECDKCGLSGDSRAGTDDFARVMAVGRAYAAGFKLVDGEMICPGCQGRKVQLGLVLGAKTS